MENRVFKRKIYEEIREWKEKYSEKYALLIKGARRVGKSTIAEEFAKNEFKSYILIDFAHTSKEIIGLFDDTYNLDFFFLQLQQLTGKRLYEKESVIIFDEVQLLPKADRQLSILWPMADTSILKPDRSYLLRKTQKIYLFRVKSERYQCIQWILRNFCGQSVMK